MGTRREHQEELWIPSCTLARPASHPFYERLNQLLAEHDFDRFVEGKCQPFYATTMGRPGLAPGIYFRLLLVGYFEGIDSERGISWRAGDSLSIREFVGIPMDEGAPDHTTMSRTRRLIDVETHRQVFHWILELLADAGLVKGKRIGIDATTLEANAALRSIVRRDSGQSYEEFLTELAQQSGIATPTREDLARVDRKRKKKGSNEEWVNPHDPDARITKMKDGSTHLAHKAEHAVDMETGAVVAVTLQEADLGDTTTIKETLAEAGTTVADLIEREAETRPAEKPQVHVGGVEEVVADKGYHSGPVLQELKAAGVRTYIPEKKQAGKRHWVGKEEQRDAVYANRQRLQRVKGKRLLRKRGELIERTFAHCYETGGMRRTHLRKHDNILKRLLIHVAGMNLGLLLRSVYGIGTPRGLQDLSITLDFLVALIVCASGEENSQPARTGVTADGLVTSLCHLHLCADFERSENQNSTKTPGC
ncbi:MAG: transposase [Alphaproteobacteria bacterium]|nr:transposase [Alphaproteobacteria bacterium]